MHARKKHITPILREFRGLESSAQTTRIGITLIELLVAAAMGTIVVAATGIGLMAMLRSDNRSKQLTNRRAELNRAVGLIEEEIKMSRKIVEIASSSSTPKFTCTYDKKVLSIEIPGVAQNIIYYTQPVSITAYGAARMQPTVGG